MGRRCFTNHKWRHTGGASVGWGFGKQIQWDVECMNCGEIRSFDHNPNEDIMATKENPGKFDCYANAAPDEPLFVLLARDEGAPALVEAWAKERLRQISTGARAPGDAEQCLEAFECAAAMRVWKAKKDGAARVTQG